MLRLINMKGLYMLFLLGNLAYYSFAFSSVGVTNDPLAREEAAVLRSLPFRESDVTAPPSLTLLTLARERVHVETGVLIFTSVTWNYMDMFDNWLCSLSAHDFKHYVVFAGDLASLEHLRVRGEPVFADDDVEELARERQAGRDASIRTLEDTDALVVRVLGRAGQLIVQRGKEPHQYGSSNPPAKLAKFIAETARSSPQSPKSARFATVEFELLMLQRLRHMNSLLKAGYHVHLNDCDTVWLRDPRMYYPYLQRPPSQVGVRENRPLTSFIQSMDLEDVDILAQDEMPHQPSMRGHICTGNVIVFARPRAIRVWFLAVHKLRVLLLESVRKLEEMARQSGHSMDHGAAAITQNEQDFLHEISRQPAWRRQLKIYFWNPKLFPSGKYYFDQRVPQTSGIVPANIHNTWILGHDRKVKRFFDHGLWLIADSSPATSELSRSIQYSCCASNRPPARCLLTPVNIDESHSDPININPPKRLRGPYPKSQEIILGLNFPWKGAQSLHDLVYRRDETPDEIRKRRQQASGFISSSQSTA